MQDNGFASRMKTKHTTSENVSTRNLKANIRVCLMGELWKYGIPDHPRFGVVETKRCRPGQWADVDQSNPVTATRLLGDLISSDCCTE